MRDVFLLSGAGISTESGIPDYRGPHSPTVKRKLIQFQQYVEDEKVRRMYWARSFVGWPRVRDAQPNEGHKGVCELEKNGYLNGIVTQNVDGLHQQAGSRLVVELHGALRNVICLACGTRESRNTFQERIEEKNTHWKFKNVQFAPDGDVEIPYHITEDFTVPDCMRCGGMVKPDVVLFGENVPKNHVQAAWNLYKTSKAVLVVGSSLTVFSGYRFVRQAEKDQKPVAVVNIGPVRGKGKFFQIEAPIGKTFMTLLRML